MAVDGFDLRGKRALVVCEGGDWQGAVLDAFKEAGAQILYATVGDSEGLVLEAIEVMGGLDILVVGADHRVAAPFSAMMDDELEHLVTVNIVRPLRLLRASGQAMLEQGNGRIIVIHSILAERGIPNTAAFSATQAAVAQLVRALAIEWARTPLRINGIALGWFEDDPLIPTAEAERLARYLASKRLGRWEEVGALAVYLASDAADMMNGQSIVVDGGAMVHA